MRLFPTENQLVQLFFSAKAFLNFCQFFVKFINFCLKFTCFFLSSSRGILQRDAGKQRGNIGEHAVFLVGDNAILSICRIAGGTRFFICSFVFCLCCLNVCLSGSVLRQCGKSWMMDGAADRTGRSFCQCACHNTGLLPKECRVLIVVCPQKAVGCT